MIRQLTSDVYDYYRKTYMISSEIRKAHRRVRVLLKHKSNTKKKNRIKSLKYRIRKTKRNIKELEVQLSNLEAEHKLERLLEQ